MNQVFAVFGKREKLSLDQEVEGAHRRAREGARAPRLPESGRHPEGARGPRHRARRFPHRDKVATKVGIPALLAWVDWARDLFRARRPRPSRRSPSPRGSSAAAATSSSSAAGAAESAKSTSWPGRGTWSWWSRSKPGREPTTVLPSTPSIRGNAGSSKGSRGPTCRRSG